MNEPRYPDVEVNLIGEDSNAMLILGIVRREMRRARVPSDDIEAFTQEAMSGDDNHLLQTCMKWVTVT